MLMFATVRRRLRLFLCPESTYNSFPRRRLRASYSTPAVVLRSHIGCLGHSHFLVRVHDAIAHDGHEALDWLGLGLLAHAAAELCAALVERA